MLKKTVFPMLFIFLAALTIPSVRTFADEKELSAQAFLDKVRTPTGRNGKSTMKGIVRNQKKIDGENKRKEAPISLAITFMPTRTVAKLEVGENETYTIGQEYGSEKGATSVETTKKDESKELLLPYFGVKPEDLTMSFLFWDLVKEHEKDSVKGRECRVFELKSPEKAGFLKVYIDKDYYFPLKVVFYPKNEEDYTRKIEVDEFDKKDHIWYVTGLDYLGPGWRTDITFDKYDSSARNQ